MKILGIKFVPLNVPLRERLQALTAITWMITILLGGVTSTMISLYVIAYTSYWWIIVPYLFWIWFIDSGVEERAGRRSRWVRSWTWWKYLQDYFPLKLVKLPGVELDPDKNYLFCAFPHGLLAVGVFNAFVYENSGYNTYFPHHVPYTATLQEQFIFPFGRELILSLGAVSASARSIEYILSRPGGGCACVIVVGGVKEMYYCKPGDYRLNLKNRKGFVRLALRNGTPLVPVFSFGEIDLYDQFGGPPILQRIQETFRRRWFVIPPILPIGRGFFQYSFGFIPRNRPVTTVVGKPLDVSKIENPTEKVIDEYHNKFVKKLTELFDEQKYNYLVDPDNTKLIID